MYRIFNVLVRFIKSVFIGIINILEIIIAMLYVLGKKLRSLFVGAVIIMMIIPGTFQTFILEGTMMQIGLKIILLIAPALLIEAIPKALLSGLYKLKEINYINL